MTAAIAYDSPGEDLLALWLYACQCEMAARQGSGPAEDAAVAWAKLAAACARIAPFDCAIYRSLADAAAARVLQQREQP